MDGRAELILTPIELIDRLSQLITPPRVHKNRYCGVLAPNAKLRKVVIESAGPAASTQMLLDKAREKMALDETEGEDGQPSLIRKAAARCWALLCPRCEKPMRIIAFIQDPPTIEKILTHIGEATRAPEVVPARGPPQGELEFTQDVDAYDWPNMDQTTARAELLVEGDRGVLR